MSDLNHIKIIFWNVNGINSKKHELYHHMRSNFIDVACLSETFLKPHIKMARDPDFAIYRKDREDGQRGGVAIIIRKDVSHRQLPSLNTKLIENVGVEVDLVDGSKINIFSVYLPGGSLNIDLTKSLKNDILEITGRRQSYIACGDLNAKHRQWNCERANKAGNILYELYCRENFIITHPEEHTYIPTDTARRKSTIDIALTNGLHHIESIVNSPLISDHTAVEMSVIARQERKQKREQLDYSKANWVRYKRELSKLLNNSVTHAQIHTNADIDSVVKSFTEAIIEARDRSVPLTFHNEYRLNLPDELLEVIKKKNKLKNIWKRNRQQDTKTQVNQLESYIKQEIETIRNANWAHKLSNIKPGNQTVWTTARFLKNGNNTLPPLKDGNELATTKKEKADSLAKMFARNHANPLSVNCSHFSRGVEERVKTFLSDEHDSHEMHELEVSIEELKSIIKALPNKKAPGRDGIKNILLKQMPEIGYDQLYRLLSACIRNSYFPAAWKSAIVTPLHKPGKSLTDVKSFRPISLLSCLSKVLERLMLKHINKHLEDNNIIPDMQHGFRSGKSTVHQLSRVINQAKNGFETGKSTGMIIMDVEKAFDRLWIDGLLHKMIELGFNPRIIKFLASFLKERNFQVRVNGELSQQQEMKFGVPQGAVLSPVLYNIYTSDPPLAGEYETAMFADDTAKYRTAKTIKPIVKALSRAAEDISKYTHKWKIGINGDKTKAILFTRRRVRELPTGPLRIFNSSINWEDDLKYLGVKLDKRLTFKNHIDYVIGRANNAIRILYPLLCRKSSLDVRNKLLVYKLAIRPILTYGMPAMKPFIANTHIKKLQVLQNKSLKMILDKTKFESTVKIHKLARCPMIQEYIDKITQKFVSRL